VSDRCQVRGCDELAGWGLDFDAGEDVVVVVYLCREHDRQLFGVDPPEQRPELHLVPSGGEERDR
jgi:hypothetical protein